MPRSAVRSRAGPDSGAGALLAPPFGLAVDRETLVLPVARSSRVARGESPWLGLRSGPPVSTKAVDQRPRGR
jgi:hypothetical protein